MGNIKITIRYSIVLVVIFGFLTALIISSIFRTIVAGFIMSYIFYPVYKLVYSRLKMKTVSALLSTLLVLLLITVPTYFAANKLSTEVSVSFVVMNQYLAGSTDAVKCERGGMCQLIPKSLRDANPKVKALLTNTLGKVTEFVVKKTTDAIFGLPGILINLFMIFFIMYYMFKDGKVFIEKIKTGFPLQKQRQDALIDQFNRVASAVIYGTVVVAVLQGVLAGIGFFLFGVPSPIIWSVVTLIVSLVPFLGPFIVWLPASVLLMLNGYYSGDHFIFLRGLGLFLYGLLIISGIDNVLKPRLISRKARIHPALVFIGIIGGINLFGIVGFIIGPVIIAMLVAAYETYLNSRSEEKPTGNDDP